MALKLPPLFAEYDPRISWRVLPALALAALALAFAERVAGRLAWGALLAATGAATAAWAVALAFADGWRALSAPLVSRFDYIHYLPLITKVGPFVDGYAAAIPNLPYHLKSHPPGVMLVFWSLNKLHLGGGGPAAVLVIGAGASASIAALIAVRDVASEATARTVAPFLAFAPVAIWIATSADALFAGVAAWAAALIVVATGRHRWQGDGLAVGGGLLLGAAAFMSYGMAVISLMPAAVAFRRRRLRPIVVAGLAALAVALAFAVAGFWWPTGLTRARAAQDAGVFALRPYGYFVIANLAALAIALGPAASLIPRLRDRDVWLLVGGALAAVAIADVSGAAKGEVERIWLAFMPWLLLVTAALRRARPWLAAQVVAALALQVTVRSPW
jgi:hypothetical protein